MKETGKAPRVPGFAHLWMKQELQAEELLQIWMPGPPFPPDAARAEWQQEPPELRREPVYRRDRMKGFDNWK